MVLIILSVRLSCSHKGINIHIIVVKAWVQFYVLNFVFTIISQDLKNVVAGDKKMWWHHHNYNIIA